MATPNILGLASSREWYKDARASLICAYVLQILKTAGMSQVTFLQYK